MFKIDNNYIIIPLGIASSQAYFESNSMKLILRKNSNNSVLAYNSKDGSDIEIPFLSSASRCFLETTRDIYYTFDNKILSIPLNSLNINSIINSGVSPKVELITDDTISHLYVCENAYWYVKKKRTLYKNSTIVWVSPLNVINISEDTIVLIAVMRNAYRIFYINTNLTNKPFIDIPAYNICTFAFAFAFAFKKISSPPYHLRQILF